MSLPYEVSPGWRLIAQDSRNWTLQRRRMLKRYDKITHEPTGEEYEDWRDEGYYASVESALRGWAQRWARESQLPLPEALAAVIGRLESVLAEILAATQGV